MNSNSNYKKRVCHFKFISKTCRDLNLRLAIAAKRLFSFAFLQIIFCFLFLLFSKTNAIDIFRKDFIVVKGLRAISGCTEKE